MKILSWDLAEKISRFQSDKYSITSFFLDTDKSRWTKKEIVVSAKNLLSSGRDRLAELDAAKDKRTSLEKDLASIEAFVYQNMSTNVPGLALYACAGAGIWEPIALPTAPRNRIVFDRTPYIRPLSLILDRFRPLIILLLDRREARWFELSMGVLAPLARFTSEIPKKVKSGLVGPEAKRLERHVANAVMNHFKRAAQQTFDLFKKNSFDGLLVGCPNGVYGEFESVLHPYVRERLKGKLKAKPGDPPDKVLRECLALDANLRQRAEEDLIARLLGEVEKGGRATSGLRECLKRLNKREVRELVVTRYFVSPGTSCPRCGLLFLDEDRCPACDRKTVPLPDVVDEAVQKAWETQCLVRHITPPSRLDRYGKIGAFLRFKT
jgi:peptide subunit release factor 1 (eRF1)